MDVNKTPSKQSSGSRDADITEKTAAAIAAEKPPPPPAVADEPAVPPAPPQLPRDQQPQPRPRPDRNRGPMVCRMFFPSSGHMGFDMINSSTETPPLEIVREMIDYETRLRLCDSIQQLMDEYHQDEAAVTYVVPSCAASML